MPQFTVIMSNKTNKNKVGSDRQQGRWYRRDQVRFCDVCGVPVKDGCLCPSCDAFISQMLTLEERRAHEHGEYRKGFL